MRTMLHSPRRRMRSIAAATLGALAMLGTLLVATPAQALNDTGTGGVFVPATGRFMDTSRNIGGYDTAMPAKEWRTVKVTGKNGVPDDGTVGAVSVVATAASISGQGILYGRPDADAKSTVMGIYGGDDKQNTSFSSVLAVADDGTIQVQAETSIRLILDVQGYYTASTDGTAAGGFVPLNGTRIADTRAGQGFAKKTIGPRERVTLQVAGVGGIPKGASAAIINMIAVNRTAGAGYITPYPTGGTQPPNSFNYAGSTATSMQAQVQLSSDGKITFFNDNSTTDLVVDTQGYFTAAGKSGAVFTPGAGRAYDTRSAGNTVMGKNETRSIQIAGKAGVPVMGSGINAVVLTLTSLKSTAGAGNATVWADGTTRPNTTSINFDETTIRTNTITVPLGANGKVSINSVADPTNYVFDVQGWYSTPQSPTIACAAPFSAGSWTADASSSTSGIPCTLTAPPASETGQTLELSVNDLPAATFALSSDQANTFSYQLFGANGATLLEAHITDGLTNGPAVTYEFGVGDWSSEALVPSIEDGAVVELENVAIVPISPATGVLPADAVISYALTDTTAGTVTTIADADYRPIGGLDLVKGHSYSWQATVSAARGWSDRPSVTTPSWTFRVAAEGEQVPIADSDDEQTTAPMARAKPNGCTGVPQSFGKAYFKPACDQHDICYGSRTDRVKCDGAFLYNLSKICEGAYPKGAKRNTCYGIAATYYTGVRNLGWAFYRGSGRNN